MSEYDKETLQMFTNKAKRLGFSDEKTITLYAILIEMWLYESKDL